MNKYLWFTVNTIPNYELKVSKELMLVKEKLGLDEIDKVYVPMIDYVTPRGVTKQKPRTPRYFYIRLRANANDQPSSEIWHRIRNTNGCVGLLHMDNDMHSMTDEEFEEEVLNIE